MLKNKETQENKALQLFIEESNSNSNNLFISSSEFIKKKVLNNLSIDTNYNQKQNITTSINIFDNNSSKFIDEDIEINLELSDSSDSYKVPTNTPSDLPSNLSISPLSTLSNKKETDSMNIIVEKMLKNNKDVIKINKNL
jgi:hypothetical protein